MRSILTQKGLRAGQTVWLLVVICLMASFSAHAQTQTQFSVNRQSIILSANPGEEIVGSFRVSNHSDEPLQMRVTPVDYTMDPRGQIVTPEAGTTDGSLLPYLVLAPTQFSIEPGGFVDVQYVVNVPEDFTGSRWIAFLTRAEGGEPAAVQEQRQAAGTSIQFRFQVVYRTLLVVTAEGTEEPGASLLSLRRVIDGDSTEFHVVVRNDGNSFFRASGRVEIRDASGQAVKTYSLARRGLLPGHFGTLVADAGEMGLAQGEYLALAIVDFEGDHLIAGQLRFRIE